MFPLSTLAVSVVKRAIGDRELGYVFLNLKTNDRYYSIHKTFDRAVRKLDLKVGVTKLRFHDLRHIFATWLHREGVSLDVLRPLLGHEQRSTTDRYAYLDVKTVGNAVNLMPRIRRGNEGEMARIGKVC